MPAPLTPVSATKKQQSLTYANAAPEDPDQLFESLDSGVLHFTVTADPQLLVTDRPKSWASTTLHKAGFFTHSLDPI